MANAKTGRWASCKRVSDLLGQQCSEQKAGIVEVSRTISCFSSPGEFRFSIYLLADASKRDRIN